MKCIENAAFWTIHALLLAHKKDSFFRQRNLVNPMILQVINTKNSSKKRHA